MIQDIYFTKKWIDNVKKDFPAVDPTILEKTIYAFELVSSLVNEGLEFIFKGGTSLLLLLPKPARLSIDADIITNTTPQNLENKFTAILTKNKFSEWIEDTRSQSNIPKKHYKFFYSSTINPQLKSYVLLDVLFQNNPYPKIESKSIEIPYLKIETDIYVNIPTVNSILGDKLTAFAPNTTGIAFGINKAMEINKQLFDVGALFNISDDIEEIKTSFNNFIMLESEYRGKQFSTNDVIKDIVEISFKISQINLKGGFKNKVTDEFLQGMKSLRSHLISGTYNLEDAKINAAKTAFCVSTFNKKVDYLELKNYDINKIKESNLTDDLQIFERLKNIIPEAYYYWQLVQELRKFY
jgi:hypothetical protein